MVVAMINETAPALAQDLHEGRERLWDLLDRWMTLDESSVTWEEVEALYNDIVGFWRADPGTAEAWHEAWRATRSACRS